MRGEGWSHTRERDVGFAHTGMTAAVSSGETNHSLSAFKFRVPGLGFRASLERRNSLSAAGFIV